MREWSCLYQIFWWNWIICQHTISNTIRYKPWVLKKLFLTLMHTFFHTSFFNIEKFQFSINLCLPCKTKKIKKIKSINRLTHCYNRLRGLLFSPFNWLTSPLNRSSSFFNNLLTLQVKQSIEAHIQSTNIYNILKNYEILHSSSNARVLRTFSKSLQIDHESFSIHAYSSKRHLMV